MNGANFRWVGFSLLSGAAVAVGCGGDDGGSGGSNGSNGSNVTTSTVTTTIGNVTNNVNTATSSQSTSGTANGTSGSTTGSTGTTGTSTTGTTGSTTDSTASTGTTGSTTGTTGSTTDTTGSTTGTTGSTTGSGGGAGSGCEDDPPVVGGGEAGAAGAGGASEGTELTEGFNFVEESEVGEWSIMACADGATDCVDDAGGSVGFSCGVLQVEVNWPEAANTAAAKFQIQNVVPESMLHDLTGKTLYARVRQTSEGVAGHGYDFNVVAQDYIDDADDTNDWKWFSTCYNGSGSCPENPSVETWGPGDGWVLLALPMSAELAPDAFAFDSIRKFAIEIATKHWDDGEPFSYDAEPTSFEIDYVAW